MRRRATCTVLCFVYPLIDSWVADPAADPPAASEAADQEKVPPQPKAPSEQPPQRNGWHVLHRAVRAVPVFDAHYCML